MAIVGAGVSGLATAALLAQKGYQVKVFEKNSTIGGRARVWKSKGFTFDMGPSWYMMPEVFEDFFEIFGKKVNQMYKLVRLDPHYSVITGSGKKYEVRKNLNKNLEMFEKNESGGAEKLKKFLGRSQRLYEKAMRNLVYQDYRDWKSMMKPEIIKGLFELDLGRSFHRAVEAYFSNPDLQKILEFTTVFLGGSPYNTPAFYTLIAHADFNLGIWYPKGGMVMVPDALRQLVLANGGQIALNEEVNRIVTREGKVTGIRTKKGYYEADAVVAACDYHFVETHLLGDEDRVYGDGYWKKRTLAPSALVIYLGVKGKIKNLTHHLLYFDDSWEKHFDEVYLDPKWPENPSYYVHCPSKTDSGVAPRGCEAVMILVPLAPGVEDSDLNREKYGGKILQHLAGLLGEDFRDRIEVRRMYAHRDFSGDYNALAGTAFGLAHTLGQTAIFRPRNYSRKVRGLYYSGQYTNPGVGVPVGLISARIAAGLVEKDIKK